MTKEEFEWRNNQYKMVNEHMPQALHDLKTHSQRMHDHFVDDPDALAKWGRYESDVYAAFASLKSSISSPPYLPSSVLYKHLMKRKVDSKTFVGSLCRGLGKSKRIVGAGEIGIVVGLAIGPACWNQWKQQNG